MLFRSGFLSGEAKIEQYRRASIFCFLSYTEGMPNAVLEALAMGLPLLSSDVGGLRDILTDGVTGCIVRPSDEAPAGQKFDPFTVADRIHSLASNAELYARIAGHNALYARQRFNARDVARRIESIYASVMDLDALAPSHHPVS